MQTEYAIENKTSTYGIHKILFSVHPALMGSVESKNGPLHMSTLCFTCVNCEISERKDLFSLNDVHLRMQYAPCFNSVNIIHHLLRESAR